jgi:hypothetical protein
LPGLSKGVVGVFFELLDDVIAFEGDFDAGVLEDFGHFSDLRR